VNLLKTILAVLDAAYSVSGAGGKALIDFARWVVNRYVPADTTADDAVAIVPLTGDAPPDVKSAVAKLFDLVIGFVSNPIYSRVISAVKHLVLNFALDAAWDAVHPTTGAVAAEPKVLIDDAAVAGVVE